MRRLLAVTGASLVLLSGALPADARLRARDIGPAPTVLASDDRHLVTTGPGDAARSGDLLVRDIDSGSRERVPSPEGCIFDAAGGGALLWSCAWTRTSDSARVRDLRTGALAAVYSVPDASGPSGFGHGSPADVGRHWVRFRLRGYHTETSLFVSRAGGTRRTLDRRDRRRVADLDRPGLVRRLCRGIVAPLVPGLYVGLAPGPIAISGQRAASLTYSEGRTAFSSRILLRRCGREPRTLDRCPRYCSEPAIDSRRVVWTRGRSDGRRQQVRVHDIRAGRTRTLTLPRGGPTQLALVRGRLWVTVGDRYYRIKGLR